MLNYKEIVISTVLIAIPILGLISSSAEAKHLKLYTYDVLAQGETAATYTFDLIEGAADSSVTGNPILHEIEVEYGVTPHWTQSLYIDYDFRAGKVNEITALKTEFNYAFFEKGENFVDFRLNAEYAMAVKNHVDAFGGTDTPDTIEFRPIFEKNFDIFTLVIGPIFFKEVAAPNNVPLESWTYGYANAVMRDLTDKIGVGLEFHGSFSDTAHYIVPNIDWAVTDTIGLSLGLGLGLTGESDDITFRVTSVLTF